MLCAPNAWYGRPECWVDGDRDRHTLFCADPCETCKHIPLELTFGAAEDRIYVRHSAVAILERNVLKILIIVSDCRPTGLSSRAGTSEPFPLYTQ